MTRIRHTPLDLVAWRDVFRQLAFIQDRVAGNRPNADNVTWIVGSDKEYAAFVEFGTSQQEAQPYLRKALAEVAEDPDRYVDDAKSVEGYVRNVALAVERRAKIHAPVDTGALQASIEAFRVE